MNTTMGWAIVSVLTLIIIALAVLLFIVPSKTPVAVTTPPATTTNSGTGTSTQQPSGKVVIDSPKPNATVPKTFTVTGKAIGPWYFEASFPVQVRDKDNNKIGQGIAQAQGDWMTENYVPFTAAITVTGYTGPATLILLKDNPSGLPENDDSVEIPIVIQ